MSVILENKKYLAIGAGLLILVLALAWFVSGLIPNEQEIEEKRMTDVYPIISQMLEETARFKPEKTKPIETIINEDSPELYYFQEQEKYVEEAEYLYKKPEWIFSVDTPFIQYKYAEWEVNNIRILNASEEIEGKIYVRLDLDLKADLHDKIPGDSPNDSYFSVTNLIKFSNLLFVLHNDGGSYKLEIPEETEQRTGQYLLSWGRENNVDPVLSEYVGENNEQ